MTGCLRLILGDQLTREVAALRGLDPARDTVLMVEVAEEARYVRHHQQKIALILSAMRHFAADLRAEGIAVRYVTLDDPANTHSFTGEVLRALADLGPQPVIVTEPGEWRVLQMIDHWRDDLGLAVDLRADDRFFCSRDAFARLTDARKTGRMEYFYRVLRQRHGVLMEGAQPVGGQWNFDAENRKRLPPDLRVPRAPRFAPDAITVEVLTLVAARFGDHFGRLETFGWAVTRADALQALAHFITAALPWFGDYQDAMQDGTDVLFHSALSPYLNCGLLTPREVCAAAEAALHAGHAPLNAVEGFIRQILGWREFVRGIYWTMGPGYGRSNHLNARRDLPAFFWTGATAMRCQAEAIRNTRDNAYAHHIQRLMVTGNFALLAGIDPRQVQDWYLAVYADAFEWVELPNVHGMVLHADGGRVGSKPYAASGAYIQRMSDHCGHCRFDPQEKTGPRACPLNYLYWNFLIENRDRLGANARMALSYRNLDRMPETARDRVQADAARFLQQIATGDHAPTPVMHQQDLPLDLS